MNLQQAFQSAFFDTMLVIYLVCCVSSAIGFYKFVYFMSIGYGLAIAASSLTMLLQYKDSVTLLASMLCLLYIAYGLRLSSFLLIRELKQKSYRAMISKEFGDKPMPFFVKMVIWLACSSLYVAQISPVLYRLENRKEAYASAVVGILIMLFALVLETIADRQKAKAKVHDPQRFCSTGLYRWVRCPNYLGEVLFWTGSLISGFGALITGLQYIVAISGYLLLVYVMLSGAKRLEKRQNLRYQKDEEYQRYVQNTPILFPFIKLYSLKNARFIV